MTMALTNFRHALYGRADAAHAKPRTLALAATTALLLAACAGPTEHFMLQPSSDGSTGSMKAVAKDGKNFVLDAKQPVAQSRGGSVEASTTDLSTLKQRFQAATDAQPLPPATYRLHFTEGGDQLTPESQAQLDAIVEEIKRRPVPDLAVVGHTDRVGSVEANDKLALRRAQSVQQLFEQRGITTDSIHASGRGERQPLVETPDEVAEPRNRRVEILVR